MSKKLTKAVAALLSIFLVENLISEIWYRLNHHLPVFQKLAALPAYEPPMPTVFTSLFWANHNPDNILLALLVHIIFSIILTLAVFFIIHISKKRQNLK